MGKFAEFMTLAGASSLAISAMLLAAKASDDNGGFGPVGRAVAVGSGAATPLVLLGIAQLTGFGGFGVTPSPAASP